MPLLWLSNVSCQTNIKVIIDKGADKVLPGSVTSGKYRESSQRIDNELEAVESSNIFSILFMY